MKKLSRFVSVFISVIISVFFASCADQSVKSPVSVTELSLAISSAVPLDDGYYTASESYCKYYFRDESGTSLLGGIVGPENFTVQKSKSQSSENEFGIFITDFQKTKALKSICEKYIETRKKAYMEAKAAYSPEEFEKFRDAEVFVYDVYVIYFIMNRSDINIAKKSVSALFK